MNRKARAKPAFEIAIVPSQDGLPPGNTHPYRYMGADTREALLVEDLLEILKGASGATAKEGSPEAVSPPPRDQN